MTVNAFERESLLPATQDLLEPPQFNRRCSRSSAGSWYRAIMSSGNPILGQLRAYWLGIVVCMGGFLFGYDSGIVGGVITFESFEHDFGYTKSNSNEISSLVVSLQQAGAFVGCFLIWPVTHRLGRKYSIMLCSFVFCIGAMLETINTHSLGAFYVGRIVAGLGLGGATVLVPMMSSECAPKNMRGQVGCFFQLMYTIGILISYWCDYGVSKGIRTSARQWQIPIALQLVPGALLGLGMFTLPESVRWLTQVGRHEEAWRSLVWYRASSDLAVHAEMEEIRVGVEVETKQTAGFRIIELTYRRNRGLVITAFLVFLAQQSTGATAFAYYAPKYFQSLVGAGDTDLLLTGIFGAVKVVACATFVFLFSERFGRRISLIFGAFFMAACHISTSAVVKTYPPPTEASAHVSSSGIATVALVYLFIIAYNMTWGPLPWPYVSEIFPTRIREPGIAIGVASQWLFNFVYTLATPYMVSEMKWGVYLFWGLLNVVIGLGTWLGLKETRGKSLEEINAELDHPNGRLMLASRNRDEFVEAASLESPQKLPAQVHTGDI